MLISRFGSHSGYSREQDFTRTSLSITAYPRDTEYEARSLNDVLLNLTNQRIENGNQVKVNLRGYCIVIIVGDYGFVPFFYGPTASRACNFDLNTPVESRSPPKFEVCGDNTNL